MKAGKIIEPDVEIGLEQGATGEMLWRKGGREGENLLDNNGSKK